MKHEQLDLFTRRAIPELDPPGELTAASQGVELYWVKGKNFWYFRYWFHRKDGSLVRIHIPGGNSSSGIARARANLVKEAIARGDRPDQICQMIRQFAGGRVRS